MLFGDFLTLMQRAGNGRESTVKEVFYLEYLALHQYMGEKMEDMMPLPFDIANSSLKHLVTNLWIGR